MSKKIEPGCRAVIVNSQAGNDGIEVVVFSYIGDVNTVNGLRFDQGRRWNIDKIVPTDRGNMISHIAEMHLKRIDDYDGNKKASWDDACNVWTPNQLTVN